MARQEARIEIVTAARLGADEQGHTLAAIKTFRRLRRGRAGCRQRDGKQDDEREHNSDSRHVFLPRPASPRIRSRSSHPIRPTYVAGGRGGMVGGGGKAPGGDGV